MECQRCLWFNWNRCFINLVHVDHFKPSFNGISHHLVSEQVLNRVVASDHESIIVKRQRTSFNFTTTCPFVCPDLDIMSKAVRVHVVEDYGFLTGISVPPLVLLFNKCIRVLSGCVWLTSSWDSVNPYPSTAGVIDWDLSVESIGIDTLLDFEVFLNVN